MEYFPDWEAKLCDQKATAGIKVFGRQVIFAITSEHSTAGCGLPVLIAWFIPAHLVSPTLPSLQMITVQNHLRLKNPVQSILFSPAAQGCKKNTLYQLFSLLLYIFKLDLGMTIYYSACYGLPKINDFLTQSFRLSKSSFHAAWG